MSRITEIVLFIVCIQAMAGYINASGEFPNNTMNLGKNITDHDREKYSNTNPGIANYLTGFWDMAWESFLFFVTILEAVLLVSYMLIQFGVPLELAITIQGAVWFLYVLWYVQWKSGKGFKMYE